MMSTRQKRFRAVLYGALVALGVLALVLAWVQFVRQAEPEARSVTATGAETLTANTAVSTTVATLDAVGLAKAQDLTLWVEYVKGTEGGITLTTYFLPVYGSTAYQELAWSASGGTRTGTSNVYSMTATGNYYLSYDVGGIPYFYATVQAGGTPSGVVTVTYSIGE